VKLEGVEVEDFAPADVEHVRGHVTLQVAAQLQSLQSLQQEGASGQIPQVEVTLIRG
jgi:hypothetical protein